MWLGSRAPDRRPLATGTPNTSKNVIGETADCYRYFDATPHAEFLYGCVRKTIEEDLPHETQFLRSFDLFRSSLATIADMPHKTIDLLFNFLHKNNGALSKRAQEKEFAALTKKEVKQVERMYEQAFADQN